MDEAQSRLDVAREQYEKEHLKKHKKRKKKPDIVLVGVHIR